MIPSFNLSTYSFYYAISYKRTQSKRGKCLNRAKAYDTMTGDDKALPYDPQEVFTP